MKNHVLHIRRYLSPQGLIIAFNKRRYEINYPVKVWKRFPVVYHQTFADAVTYSFTLHLSFKDFQYQKLVYHFPPPILEPLLFKGTLYSLVEDAIFDGSATKYLQLFFNANQGISFTRRPRYEHFKNINHHNHRKSLIPFTFGKDSLLSFALSLELGIKPILIFFREPRSPYENRYKKILSERFFRNFKEEVTFFPVNSGWLRETDESGPWWGWDLLLTQYTLLLIPYLFAHRAKYLFWSHEQSCNQIFTNKEGYFINPVFEQNHQWLLSTNAAMKVLGCNSIFASLVEPLHEIAIMQILHHRYPHIGKYQASCFFDEVPSKTRRWCAVCSKCARIYIFMKALGIDPRRVGFTQNMLQQRKKELFSLFGAKTDESGSYDASGVGRDEQLLAFYLAYKRGVKGSLMKEFERRYLKEAQKRKQELLENFFSVHPPQTLTYELKQPLLKIFSEELAFFKKQNRSILA